MYVIAPRSRDPDQKLRHRQVPSPSPPAMRALKQVQLEAKTLTLPLLE